MSATILYEPIAPVHPQVTAVLGLGIIGFGNIGRQHYNVALRNPNLEVKSVADPNLQQADLHPSTTAFHDWETLLHDPEIEAVSICVPHHLHYRITMAALEAGKHVLVEKPLGLTVREGRELIACARQHQRIIMVELTHRFYPAVREARQFVQAGGLGKIFAVEDRIIETVGPQIKPWLRDKQLAGGGVALTNGIHMLDRIAALTGQRLTFLCGTVGYSARLGNVEDTAAMLLHLENGAPVQLLAAWPQGDKAADDELTLYGEKGTLRVWAWRGWRFEPACKTSIRERLCHEAMENTDSRIQAGITGALEEFAAAIREQRQPYPAAQDALEAQSLIEQFYAHIA